MQSYREEHKYFQFCKIYSFTRSLIHSFNTHLLRACFMSDIVFRNTGQIYNTKSPPSWSL